LGRPLNVRNGTIDLNCDGVSGGADGSDFAAAMIRLSSSGVGATTTDRLDVFDIVLHLSTSSAAQADDTARFATLNK
jgi:hypothetical protein